MVVIPHKLVQGSKIHVDLAPEKLKYSSRRKIGMAYAGLLIEEAITLAKFVVNALIAFFFLGATVFWNFWFILPFSLASLFLLKTHYDYVDVWSLKYKFGRKRVTRIDDEVVERESIRAPLTIIGKDYAFKKVFKTKEGMFY